MATTLRTAPAKALLTKCVQSELYPSHLRQFYGINAKLKKEGISAPQEVSVANTNRLYEAIGRPLDKIPTLHVGGTNGKGTTSFKLSEVLRNNGIKTGLFVSPHLASFRERIQVDAELLPEESFVRNLQTLTSLCAQHEIAATEFELTFLMAALHFQQTKCEAVVLEVGLGGEYDATNVVNTALSIICSVSLDHTRILGPTVEAIAKNKAGIFKRNQPALVGPGVPAVAQELALQRGAHFYTYDAAYEEFHPALWKHNLDLSASDSAHGVTFSPMVDSDALNANIALLGLYQLQKYRPAAFWRPPCRWEVHVYKLPTAGTAEDVDRTTTTAVKVHSSSVFKDMNGAQGHVVLDMGHNPAALGALARRIAHKFPGRNVHMVYAMSRDKDVHTHLKNALTVIPPSNIHFVQSKNVRAISREDLSAMFREETGHEMTQLAGSGIQDTLREVTELIARQTTAAAVDTAAGVTSIYSVDSAVERQRGVMVVCGTGYIMPEARAFLGIVETRDELDLRRGQL